MKSHFAVNRRTLLKTVAGTAAVSVIGLPMFASVAAASCAPRTPGYWGNHDFPASALFEPQNRLYKVTGIQQDQEAWQEFLLQPAQGDKAKILGPHLVATVLNFQYRTSAADDCVRQEITGSEWSYLEGLADEDGKTLTVEYVKDLAADWFAASSYPDSKQTSWMIEVDGRDVDGEQVKNLLDAFNNDPGSLGLSCVVEDCRLDEPNGGNGNGRRR